jgi:putative spermidine/putrescine transport system permease protein
MFKSLNKTFNLSVLLLFTLLPLVAGLAYALAYSFGLVGVLNKGFTLENWEILFSTSEVYISILYTSWLAFASLSICIFISLAVVLAFPSKFKSGIFSYLVYMPLAFPSIVAAFFFFQFLSNAGILARFCYQLGIISQMSDFPNLVNDSYHIGIISTQTFLSLPFFILLYASLYQAEKLEDFQKLAYALGASKKQTIFKISIPILLKRSLPSIIIYFIFKLGSYEVPLLLGKSSPETISVLAVRKLQKFNLLDIPQGYAVAVIYAFLVLLLLFIAFKKSKHQYEV